MKRTIKVFLVSAVFFVVLMLAGCGIPSILYLKDSTDYTFSGSFSGSENGNYVEISKLSVTSSDSLLSECYGPSVMFFYTIGTSNDVTSLYGGGDGGIVATAFSEKFYPEYLGATVYSVSPLKFDSNKRTLYSFNKSGNTSFVFNSPDYVLYATDDYSDILTDAELQYDSTNGCFILSWNGNYSLNENAGSGTSLSLFRYNGLEFIKSYDSSASDYSAVTSTDNNPWIYIYAAFSILPNKSSEFNNIFWSPLLCLGYINLNQST